MFECLRPAGFRSLAIVLAGVLPFEQFEFLDIRVRPKELFVCDLNRWCDVAVAKPDIESLRIDIGGRGGFSLGVIAPFSRGCGAAASSRTDGSSAARASFTVIDEALILVVLRCVLADDCSQSLRNCAVARVTHPEAPA